VVYGRKKNGGKLFSPHFLLLLFAVIFPCPVEMVVGGGEYEKKEKLVWGKAHFLKNSSGTLLSCFVSTKLKSANLACIIRLEKS